MCKAKRDGDRCAYHTRMDWHDALGELNTLQERHQDAYRAGNQTEAKAIEAAIAETRYKVSKAMTLHASTPSGWVEVYRFGFKQRDQNLSDASLAALSRGGAALDSNHPVNLEALKKVTKIAIPETMTRSHMVKVGAKLTQLDVGESFTVTQGPHSATVTRKDNGYWMTSARGGWKPVIVDHRHDRNGAHVLLHVEWPDMKAVGAAQKALIEAAPDTEERASTLAYNTIMRYTSIPQQSLTRPGSGGLRPLAAHLRSDCIGQPHTGSHEPSFEGVSPQEQRHYEVATHKIVRAYRDAVMSSV